jgi:F0F1-type ATP synthase membrane subunit b/b'
MSFLSNGFWALSFDFDTLVPILFFVLYGLSQFLGGKKKADQEEEGSQEDGQALEEARERARQIREEIQRKIRERQVASRKQGSGDWESPPVVQPPEPVEQEVSLADPVDQEQPTTPADDDQSVYGDYQTPLQSEIERRLEEQRARLAETKRKNEEARKEANRRRKEAFAKAQKIRQQARAEHALKRVRPAPSAGSGFREELVDGLRRPETLRKAILYREILDPPLGLR